MLKAITVIIVIDRRYLPISNFKVNITTTTEKPLPVRAQQPNLGVVVSGGPNHALKIWLVDPFQVVTAERQWGDQAQKHAKQRYDWQPLDLASALVAIELGAVT